MTVSDNPYLQELMQTPEVRNAISSVNEGMVQRRAFKPPRCTVFEHPYTVLEENRGFRFEIDAEAQRQLPRIINNPVQVVVGRDSLDEGERQAYQRPHTVGIVFSGGPAPGGHNVIAGLFDALRAANPASRLIGFLMGPDGIIESEYVEITDALVDHYRNIGGFFMIVTGST